MPFEQRTYRESILECWIIRPSLSVMYVAFWSSSADDGKRKKNDQNEEDDLDQGCAIFEPRKDCIGHGKDYASHDHKDSNYPEVRDLARSTLLKECGRTVATECKARLFAPCQYKRVNLREAALGKSPFAQNWIRMWKNDASAATMDVHPKSNSVVGPTVFGDDFTYPFCQTGAKGQSWVDPSVCIVDVVARSGKGDGHFRESLQDSPDA